MLPNFPAQPFFHLLMSVLAHHDEPADPTLLEWVKGLLDHFIGGGPWMVVALLGLLIVALPVGVVVFYLLNRRPYRQPEGE